MSPHSSQAVTDDNGTRTIMLRWDPRDEWARGILEQVGHRIDAPATAGESTVVIGRLACDPQALESLALHTDSPDSNWIVLPPGTGRHLAELTFVEARDLVAAWTAFGTVLVGDVQDLAKVTAFAPTQALRIARCEPLTGDRVMDRVASPDSEGPWAVISASSSWQCEDTGQSPLHFVFDRPSDLPTRSMGHEHWCAAEDTRRGDDGHVDARLAAWLLHGMVESRGASLLVVDRFELLASLVTSPNVTVAVGYMLSSETLERFRDAPPRNLGGVLSRLADTHGWVFVQDESSGQQLRDLGYSGRVRILDPSATCSVRLLVEVARQSRTVRRLEHPKTLLVAGHDFKFAGELVSVLETIPELTIRYDQWPTQVVQDVAQSDRELSEADVVLCEFASHNAVWYSWHKRPGQRLVVHFHGYELFQPCVRDINVGNVDLFVFVSEFYRDRVLRELGWPPEKTAVIPNMIDATEYARPKIDEARFHLGIAGIVPVLKRPDRALDLLEQLLEHDDRYILHVRGRSPWDYGWMWQQPVVRDAYEAFYERLAENPVLLAHLSFDAFGADMGLWFRRIGWTLSPSYRETFHLAPVEGQASGAVPVVWNREGAREIFAAQFVHDSTSHAAEYIVQTNTDPGLWARRSREAQRDVNRYDVATVGPHWAEVLFTPQTSDARGVSAAFNVDTMLDTLRETPTAAGLDRVLILMMERGCSRADVQGVLDEFEHLADGISETTRSDMDRLTVREIFQNGDFLRPERCPGAGYLPIHGSALRLTVPSTAPEAPTTYMDFPADIVVEATTADGSVRDIANIPAPVHPVDAVQIAADAIVRTARRHRPAILVTTGNPFVAWPAVIAARRLGVPVILQDHDHDRPGSPPRSEYDAVWKPDCETDAALIDAVVTRHADHAADTTSVPLSQITVGLIADEFTASTISGRCRTVRIPRHDAYLTVAGQHLDVLLIESAWSGQDGEWFHGVAYYAEQREDLERAVATARARGIPVVFWNKEDPIHFRSFAPTAALCDAVFTTDANMLPEYLQQHSVGHPVVGSMPFYAEPTLHNPMPGEWSTRQTVSYAGTYYGQRYAQRSRELDELLGAAMDVGLTIYDRQRNITDSPYRFPPRYESFVDGGLSYGDVLEAYKAHPVHINVNSVTDSPTMFSRRVVEIAASGSVVISGPGRGLQECLPDLMAGSDCHEAGRVMESCMIDIDTWRDMAWRQLRAVTRAYLAEHALTIMFRSVGVPVRCDHEIPWTAVVAELDTDVAHELLAQSHRPREVVASTSSPESTRLLEERGIAVAEHPTPGRWLTTWHGDHPDTWAEDLLHAARFVSSTVRSIQSRAATDNDRGLLLAGRHGTGDEFRLVDPLVPVDEREAVTWLLPRGGAERTLVEHV